MSILDRKVLPQDQPQYEELSKRAREKQNKEDEAAYNAETERINKENAEIEKRNAEEEAKYQKELAEFNAAQNAKSEKEQIEENYALKLAEVEKQKQAQIVEFDKSIKVVDAKTRNQRKEGIAKIEFEYSKIAAGITREKQSFLLPVILREEGYPSYVVDKTARGFREGKFLTIGSARESADRLYVGKEVQAQRNRETSIQQAQNVTTKQREIYAVNVSKLNGIKGYGLEEGKTRAEAIRETPNVVTGKQAVKTRARLTGVDTGQSIMGGSKGTPSIKVTTTESYRQDPTRPASPSNPVLVRTVVRTIPEKPTTKGVSPKTNPRAFLSGLLRQDVDAAGAPKKEEPFELTPLTQTGKIRVSNLNEWNGQQTGKVRVSDPKIDRMIGFYGYEKTNEIIGNYNRIITSNNLLIKQENRKNRIEYYKYRRQQVRDDPYFKSPKAQGPPKPKYETVITPFGNIQYMLETEQIQNPARPSNEYNPFGSLAKGITNTAKSYEYLGKNLLETAQGKEATPNPRPPIQDDFFGSLTESIKQGKIKPLEEFGARQQKRDPFTIGGELLLEGAIWAIPYGAAPKLVKYGGIGIKTIAGKNKSLLAPSGGYSGKLSSYEKQQIKEKDTLYQKINKNEIKQKQKEYNQLSGKQKQELTKRIYQAEYGEYSRQRLNILKYEKEFGQGKYDNLDFDTRVRSGKIVDNIDLFRKGVTPETLKISQEIDNRPPLPRKDNKIDYDVLYALDRPPQNYHAFIGESKSLGGVFQGTRQEIGSGIGFKKDSPIKPQPKKPEDKPFSRRWDEIEKTKPEKDYLRTTGKNNMQQLLEKPKTIQKQEEKITYKTILKQEEIKKEPEKIKKKQKPQPYLLQVVNPEYYQEESYSQKIKGVQKLSFVVIPKLQSRQLSKLSSKTKLLSLQKTQTRQKTLLKSVQVQKLKEKQKPQLKQRFKQDYTPVIGTKLTPIQIQPQIAKLKQPLILKTIQLMKFPTPPPKPIFIIPPKPPRDPPRTAPPPPLLPLLPPKEEKKREKRKPQPGEKADFLGSVPESQITGIFNRIETTYGQRKINKLLRGDERVVRGQKRSGPRRSRVFVEGKANDMFGFKYESKKKNKKLRKFF